MQLTISTLISIFMMAVTSIAVAIQPPLKVGVTFDKIYTPIGFDSNDLVQFVGEGKFTTSCYRMTEPTVNVDREKMTITVGVIAYIYRGFCIQTVLPFQRPVNVGLLAAGTYKVIQKQDNHLLGEITVKQAKTSEPDDYLYAPVLQAYYRLKDQKPQILISGILPTDCMKIMEVSVEVQKDVIVVLPISQYESKPHCQDGSFPFEREIALENVPNGRYLIHVRSMNGQAINNIITISQ